MGSDDGCLSRLEAQLQADALAEIPPWASAAVASVPECGDRSSDWLLQRLAGRDGVSFLALEALRIHHPEIFKAIPPAARAAVYAGHLGGAHWFNVWGQPQETPSEAAQALIETGPAAIPFLSRLLDCDRPARSFGSEQATMSQMMNYRVCDYASALIAAIEGAKPDFTVDIGQRDRSIRKMKERLGSQ